jgi:hypothetical protein
MDLFPVYTTFCGDDAGAAATSPMFDIGDRGKLIVEFGIYAQFATITQVSAHIHTSFDMRTWSPVTSTPLSAGVTELGSQAFGRYVRATLAVSATGLFFLTFSLVGKTAERP